MSDTTMDRTKGWAWLRGRMGPALAAAALALAMTVTLGPDASAQVPTAPRAANSCTARLELDPNPVLFGLGRLIAGTATGLEPGAAFNVFVGSQRRTSGFADETGQGLFTLGVDSLAAAAVDVQVATATRCASTQLLIAGPARIRCIVTPDGRIVCPFDDLLPIDR